MTAYPAIITAIQVNTMNEFDIVLHWYRFSRMQKSYQNNLMNENIISILAQSKFQRNSIVVDPIQWTLTPVFNLSSIPLYCFTLVAKG